MELIPKNIEKFPYQKGDEFIINTLLPNRKPLDFNAKIVSIKKGRTPGALFLGMEFKELTEQTNKTLGFFLMP